MRRLLGVILVLSATAGVLAKDSAALKEKLNDVDVGDGWIYDDIDAGYAEAKKTGKPLLVSFRCVP